MNWPAFINLTPPERLDFFKSRLWDDCLGVVDTWHYDFPSRRVNRQGIMRFVVSILDVHLLWADESRGPFEWARRPFEVPDEVKDLETPRTLGEYLIGAMAHYGPVCWGWRSPAHRSGAKSKGTLRRGLFQI